MMRVFLIFLMLCCSVGTGFTQTPAPEPTPTLPPLFTDAQRAAIVAYWNTPGRYTVSALPDIGTEGPYRVRLTPEGSQWFLTYQRTVAGKAKLPPTQDARPAADSPFAAWETWVSARLAYDRALAQQTADQMNAAVLLTGSTEKATGNTQKPPLARWGRATPNPPHSRQPLFVGTQTIPSDSPSDGRPIPKTATRYLRVPATVAQNPTPLPPVPGPIPAELLAACGNPPPFANVVAPMQYQVQFEDGETFTYTDNVKMRDRYAYYRFPRGVVSYGTRLKDMTTAQLDNLFRAAGFTPSEQKIFSAVSKLEGGFETVQTYDTGFVSIGFIQFVTLAEGRHDLSNVLQMMKTNRPDEFARDFRRFGMDVRPDLTLTVVDPATGAELMGHDAVMKIIDDKRLTAVFQRAGRRDGFRIAQIKVAKAYYWPSNDTITATLPDGSVLSGKVLDIVKSEAGLACLLDRKINTGNIRLLNEVAAKVAVARNCKSINELCAYERELIAAMRYRDDFLVDTTLGQPPMPPPPTPAPVLTAKSEKPADAQKPDPTKKPETGKTDKPGTPVTPAPPIPAPATPPTPAPTEPTPVAPPTEPPPSVPSR